MNLRHSAAGIFLTVATVLAACSNAGAATTIAEFDRKTPEQQGEIIQDSVSRMVHFYNDKKHDEAKAACIMDLFTANHIEQESRGVRLLMKEFALARRHDPDYLVDKVVMRVVSRECPSPK